MADFCTRLWVLQANLWLMALVTGRFLDHHDHRCPLAGGGCPIVQQHPRYVAAKKNMPAQFICYSKEPHSMQWYKMAENSDDLYPLDNSISRYSIEWKDKFINFTIFRITYEDKGIYVCDSKNLTVEKKRPHLCGTELRVVGHSNIQQIQSRNTLKDAIIIIQSILLVIFISVPMLLFLDKVSDGISSPSQMHLQASAWDGLEVEQMATYEDITPFRDVKAKWTVGEHPGEE
ncbi:CD79B protein, partial [Ibidorhyncha struthersii]|nr:CD79B protein [Ibidorhyncha struthersii]